MKILPITNNSNSFKGLWTESSEVEYISARTSVHTYKNFYYPFADEDEDSIKKALEERKFSVSAPDAEGFGAEVFISKADRADTLSFTEKEYKAYTTFYEKVMPDSIKKVEKELQDKKLWAYVNGGLIFNIKKWSYLFKKALKSIGQTAGRI